MANSSHLNETFVSDNDCCDTNNNNIGNLLLAWHNLRVESRRWWFSSKSVILRRLSGSLGYHELLGVLGPSGSGKSTLLRCLNGTIGSAISSDSQIYLNRSQNEFPVIAFLEQHIFQTIVPHMTVREILYYAFRYKNHGKTNFLEEHMHNTIDELLLDEAILSRPFGKCSGGEQKRVAIAQELMSLVKPSLLLLDEPTTGLDSNSALVVMQTLKHLSQHYRMGIVLTIHQPNDDMLNLFDQLYILAMGGVCIYSGHPSLLQCNLEHFTNLKTEDEDEKPPIEEYLRIACRGVEDNEVCCMANETQTNQQRHLWPRITELDHLPHGIVNRVQRFHLLDFALHLSRLTRITFIHERKTFLIQIGIIALWYLSMACLFDHQMVHGSRCFSWTDTDTVNATCEATIKDENHIQHYNVYQGFVVLFLGVMTMCTSAMFFVPILKVFRNEHQNRWYSMGTFFWSFTVVKLLELVIYSLVVTVLVYFPTDHPHLDNDHINWSRLCHFAVFYLLLAVYLQSIGQLLGVIFIDYIELAIIMGQLIYASMMLINGLSMVVETAGNPLLLTIANIVGTNHISKAILYTFYGLDRCDRQDKFSLAFLQSWIDPKLVYINLASVFTNVAVLRLATLIAMYLKFSQVNNSNRMIAPKSAEALPIDYPYNATLEHAKIVVDIKQIEEPCKDNNAKKNVIVAWRDLTLFGSESWLWKTPPSWQKPRYAILNSLNGEFYSRTLNAVMGSSGAGKTSLLKVLNGRMKNQLDPESKIYLSRHTPVTTCFVTQDVTGHLWSGLTVRQLLVYASRLKNVASCSNRIDHDKIADQLLDDLILGSAADIPIQHCSGGEMKRLALGLELTSLKMPSLVCIDEPTSGLDSNSAEVVVSCLKKVVNRHSIVIVASVLSNVAVLRLSTLIAMYLKFSRVNNSNQIIAPMSGEAIPIDYVDKSTFEHAQIVVEIKQIDACDLPDKDDHAKKNVIVSWRDLTLLGSASWLWTTPPSWHKPRDAILNSLNGEFYSKTLNAVMGNSGAGKTSLLKVLNGRMKNQLDPESKIYLSRHTPVTTCFVTQDVTGHLWPGLTVRQLLVYASRLKNVSSCSNRIDHDKIADQLLDDLMLGSAADIPIQHCSGGEMKRLALGLELTSLKMPSLVCIDEPTSGLDSNSAEVVVSCLKKVVNRHSIVIVASIHQPNTEVLMMFDQIYVLARGGVCIYSGQPNAIRKYLSHHRSNQSSSSFRYPIEELVKLSCFNRKNKTVSKLIEVTQSLRINLDPMDQEICLVEGIPLNRVRFDPRSVWILICRFVAYTRSYLWLHWVIFTAVYIFYAGTMLYIYDPKIAKHSGCISFDDDFSPTCNRSSAVVFEEGQLVNSYRFNFYFSSTFLFVTLLQSTLMFLKESTFFLNENRNGWYSTGSFYLAKTIVEIIPMLSVTLLYTYMVDIYEEVRPNIYYWLVGLMIIAMVATQGLGHLVALLTRGNLTLMLLIAVSTGIFMMLLGYNPVSSMPYVYQLLASLSVTRFIGNATLILIYGFGSCAPREIQVVLYKLDIENDDSFYYCLKMLIFNLVFYRAIAIFMLIRKAKLK